MVSFTLDHLHMLTCVPVLSLKYEPLLLMTTINSSIMTQRHRTFLLYFDW